MIKTEEEVKPALKRGHEDFCYCDDCIRDRVEYFLTKQIALEKIREQEQ